MPKRNGAVAPFVKVISMNVIKLTRHAVLAALAASLLSSCAAFDRIKNIGQPPPLAAVDNPTALVTHALEIARAAGEKEGITGPASPPGRKRWL